MMNRLFILSTSVVLLFSSCASVTRGTRDSLTVNSNLPGTTVTLQRTDKPISKREMKDNKDYVVELEDKVVLRSSTPASFKLKRNGEYLVTGSKKGYKSETVRVTNKISGAGAAGFAGNVLVGGLIGVGVDSFSGATKDLTPNPVDLKLGR